MIKKIVFSIISLMLIHTISASQEDNNEAMRVAVQEANNKAMVDAIKLNNIDCIIQHIPTITNVNVETPLGATALSRLCDDVILTEQSIKSLNSLIVSSQYQDENLTSSINSHMYATLNAQLIQRKENTVKEYHKTLDAIDLLSTKKNINPNTILFYTGNPYPKRTLTCLFRYMHNSPIENKLNIDIQDEEGDTPLHKAVRNNNESNTKISEQLVLYLIALGADATIKNKNGQTPEDLAKPLSTTALIFSSIDKGDERQLRKIKYLINNSPTASFPLQIKEYSLYRIIQMPFYKEGKTPRCLVYPRDEDQDVQKTFSPGNLCSRLRNREYGLKPRIGI